MTTDERFDGLISGWLEEATPQRLPERVLAATFERTRRNRQQVGWRAILGRLQVPRVTPALGSTAVLVVVAAFAVTLFVNQQSLGKPGADLGIFEPVADRIVYEYQNGIWAVDPASSDPARTVQLASAAGIPLGWSSDGTRLLMMRGGQLFVLHADGSEKQLTETPVTARGATISPDGSRVVFAGGEGTLYAVDADGGPAERLLGPGGDLVQQPTFSPDGKRIAYTSGGGDHDNNVWVIDANSSDPHEILANQTTADAGHVRGLAWSPAGDRIALGLGGRIYTFATDGSDFRPIAGGDTSCISAETCAIDLSKSAESPYWSPDGSEIAYTTGCLEGAGAANRDGCHLVIADADGSNVRAFGFAASGPWHPAGR